MSSKNVILSFVAAAACMLVAPTQASAGANADGVPVVPLPVRTVATGGKAFVITGKTSIGCSAELLPQAEYLRDIILPSSGTTLKISNGRRGNINLRIDSTAVAHPEGYRLDVSAKEISITGHDAAGVFYGIQTLLQYLPAEVLQRSLCKNITLSVPAVSVTDHPAHPWRAVMLDAARYYYDKSFVLRFIDMMALYKLNKLQFHFIDDSGWRLEIKKYPRLTEVGAWAGSGASRLGGFYTQDDIREMVAYASTRGIEIIPEIEFPAHILSAVVAYPWLGCTGLQHEIPTQHFISRDILCVGKERTMQFIRDVLDETIALFPSRYINIGGDEAVYDNWKACPDCRALMRREGLTDAAQLQGWLTNKVALWMKERGRTAIGWEECVMRGKVNTPVVANIWHNHADSTTIGNLGHKAVLTPCTHLYFDFPESDTPGEPQHATWQPPIPLQKVYGMPLTDYSPGSVVLGVQGSFWSDQFIHGTRLQEIPALNENRSENYVEYFMLPRMLALAELAWTPAAGRNYDSFLSRLKQQYRRLDAAGLNYRVPEPLVVSETPTADGGLSIKLASPVEGARVRYTTDGTWPTVHSAIADGSAIHVGSRSDLMAITEVSPTHYSLPLYTAPDYSAYAEYGTFTADWQPLRVQTRPTAWKFECTGKVAANGHFRVSFVPTRGTDSLQVRHLRVLKRNEVVAEAEGSTTNGVTSFAFDISTFEAGTPFYIEVEACGTSGNDTAGLVFVRQM